MESFRWDQYYVTGLEDVDAQHMRLVAMINRLGDLAADPGGPHADGIASVLEELADYAVYHFTEEESLMREVDVDPRHRCGHRREHQAFTDEVARLATDTLSPDRLNHLLKYLVNWLAYHILGSDQSMARQIAMIRQGETPAAAYEIDDRKGIRVTEPLVVALNGLFQQVSARNLELQQLNQTLEAKVEERTRELALANSHLEELSLTDVLTGLPNRRHALRRLDSEWKSGGLLACVMIDCDGFKQVNDTYGHDAGDSVLRAVAQCLKDHVRTDDLVSRLGGDEFLVICPHTGLGGGMYLAEQLRTTIGGMRVTAGDGHWQGSISVGVAARTDAMRRPDDLIKEADNGVYLSKNGGRNRVSTVQSTASG